MPNSFDQFVVLKPDQGMESLPVTPDLYADLDKNYAGFKSHVLIAAHHFTANWPTWEVHPEGDEMVVLLSGSAEFKLRLSSGDQSGHLREPGSFLLVPRNTWHTALISEPTSILFITPGEGTRNEPVPPASM